MKPQHESRNDVPKADQDFVRSEREPPVTVCDLFKFCRAEKQDHFIARGKHYTVILPNGLEQIFIRRRFFKTDGVEF